MPAHGAGKNNAFQVAAFSDQIVEPVAMRNADHILLNNGPLIEYLSHVVAGGADKFYPALEGRMVGPGADKGGQRTSDEH